MNGVDFNVLTTTAQSIANLNISASITLVLVTLIAIAKAIMFFSNKK